MTFMLVCRPCSRLSKHRNGHAMEWSGGIKITVHSMKGGEKRKRKRATAEKEGDPERERVGRARKRDRTRER